jgi:uncharacterized membrane protein
LGLVALLIEADTGRAAIDLAGASAALLPVTAAGDVSSVGFSLGQAVQVSSVALFVSQVFLLEMSFELVEGAAEVVTAGFAQYEKVAEVPKETAIV